MKPTLLSRWKQLSDFTKALLIAVPVLVMVAIAKQNSLPVQSAPVATETDNSQSSSTPATSANAGHWEEAPAGITMGHYKAIKSGMSYEAICRLLGNPGTELSSSDVGGVHTVMYQWKGAGAANMNAMFQNNVLISKAQFGLD